MKEFREYKQAPWRLKIWINKLFGFRSLDPDEIFDRNIFNEFQEQAEMLKRRININKSEKMSETKIIIEEKTRLEIAAGFHKDSFLALGNIMEQRRIVANEMLRGNRNDQDYSELKHLFEVYNARIKNYLAL